MKTRAGKRSKELFDLIKTEQSDFISPTSYLLIAEKESGTPLERCHDPIQNGKGYWIANDRRFGFGLNVPRSRHASEVLKTKVE